MRTNSRQQISVILFTLLSFVQIAMLLALALEVVALERFCSYAIMILGMGMFGYSFIADTRIRAEDLCFMAIVCVAIVSAVNKNWPRRGTIAFLCYVLMISVWRSAGVIENARRIVKILYFTFAVQAAALIGLFFSPYAYKGYVEYVPVSHELTLGFSNPNQTGIIIFSTLAILLLLQQKKLAGRFWNRVILAEVTMLSVMLVLTRARISILGYAVFVFFFVFTTKRSVWNKQFFIADAMLWVPLIFVFVYEALMNSRLKNMIIWGKRFFSGRELIYREALSIWRDKLFGNLEWFLLGNLHNSHLTIMINLGVVGLLLYMLHTTNAFNRFYAKCETRQQILCTVAILCLFVMGCAETAVLTGGTIYYVYMLTFIVLGGNERVDEHRGVGAA